MKCPNCNRQCGWPDFTTRSTYLWSNQHGTKSRVFCGQCGQWTDIKEMYNPHSVEVFIVHPPNKDFPSPA